MRQMLKKVAIFGSDNGEATRVCINSLIKVLKQYHVETIIQEKLRKYIDKSCLEGISICSDLIPEDISPDLVLSVGGDGTFLETASHVGDSGIPIAGVNTGRLGFLANIQSDIEESLEKLINRKYSIIERYLIELTEPEDILSNANVALNDITIQKANLNMIRINVYVDDIFLNSYWSDGLIIATATGSTAYSLSTGGPILSPSDDSIIISPLSPHTLSVRPIVLSGSSKLRFSVEGRGTEYLVTCDFRSVRLPFQKELLISQPAYKINTINIEGQDFFSTLRNKLMWGADRRN